MYAMMRVHTPGPEGGAPINLNLVGGTDAEGDGKGMIFCSIAWTSVVPWASEAEIRCSLWPPLLTLPADSSDDAPFRF